jgi:hypothetical protein
MPEPELSLLFVRPLNRSGIRYVVGGSVAAILYGEPRFTYDVDFVAFLRDSDILRFPKIFPPPEYYVPPLEVIAAEVERPEKGQFNVIHADTSFKADFYTAGRDELNAWAFRFSRRLTYMGEPIVVAPPEYVIVRKLEYFREGGSDKHLRDIRGILNVSGDQITQSDLNEWIQRRGVETEWRKIMR